MSTLDVCWGGGRYAIGKPAMNRRIGHEISRAIDGLTAQSGASLAGEVKQPSACRGRALSKFYGQVTKGAWWMPWQKMAMKDVASCDKPRRAASRL